MVPVENLIRPAPNQFTHQLVEAEPFYFTTKQDSEAPNGRFEAGTAVVLLTYDGATRCRVVDGRGLYVEVGYESLAELARSRSERSVTQGG